MHNVALGLHFLTRGISYDVVPQQDLTFDLRRMPTRPQSGFVIRNVRATDVLHQAAPRLPSLSARPAAASGARCPHMGYSASTDGESGGFASTGAPGPNRI